MGDSSEGGGDSPPVSENVAIADYSMFANYLKKAVTVLLPEDVAPPALNAALNEKSNQECIHKFLSDSQTSTLFIQRISSKGD